jgi:hypothetical protein
MHKGFAYSNVYVFYWANCGAFTWHDDTKRSCGGEGGIGYIIIVGASNPFGKIVRVGKPQQKKKKKKYNFLAN